MDQTKIVKLDLCIRIKFLDDLNGLDILVLEYKVVNLQIEKLIE